MPRYVLCVIWLLLVRDVVVLVDAVLFTANIVFFFFFVLLLLHLSVLLLLSSVCYYMLWWLISFSLLPFLYCHSLAMKWIWIGHFYNTTDITISIKLELLNVQCVWFITSISIEMEWCLMGFPWCRHTVHVQNINYTFYWLHNGY